MNLHSSRETCLGSNPKVFIKSLFLPDVSIASGQEGLYTYTEALCTFTKGSGQEGLYTYTEALCTFTKGPGCA